MKNLIFYTISILLFLTSCTPTHKALSDSSDIFRHQYKDQIPSEETIVKTWYHYVTSNTNDGKYIVRMFYPETRQLTALTTYSNSKKMIKDGIAMSWFDYGGIKSKGQYKNGDKTGLWQYFHFEHNTKSSTGVYENGEENGVWKYYDRQERIRSAITFENGIKSGKFIEYDSLSNVINEGIYKADTIFEESNPKANPLNIVESMPLFYKCENIEDKKALTDCSNNRLLQYVYKNIRYPITAREYNVEGTSVFRFEVGKDGKIRNIKTIRGICGPIEQECLRIIKNMPTWGQPGIQDGKPVRVYFNLPIKFKLI